MGSTFLSHSSKDDDLVIGATRVLENHGARVYVDEVDPVMPPYTTEETANRLKRRMTNRAVRSFGKSKQQGQPVGAVGARDCGR